MSAPPLPEVFGNYALRDWVEVVSPDGIDWWPQTAAWGWLTAIVLVFLGRIVWRRTLHWYRNRYRREALVRLSHLKQLEDSTQFLVQLNKLLKLTALVAYSRAQVAQLTGNAWLDFLNSECEQPLFDDTLSQLLASGPYSATALDPQKRDQLLTASRAWIQAHYGVLNV